jgi:hypothetical protein
VRALLLCHHRLASQDTDAPTLGVLPIEVVLLVVEQLGASWFT